MGTANRHEGKPNPNRRLTLIDTDFINPQITQSLLRIARSTHDIPFYRSARPASICVHLRFESLFVSIRGVPFVSIRGPFRGLNLDGSGLTMPRARHRI